ncbi:MAG: ASCH domain-containing protein [Planctomycetota bacterium]|nr:ASCH domain-containing protein [Planctomycetota bacterium]
MTEYPQKTCEIDRLVTHDKLVAATLQGRKTQQRRDGIYGYPGETFQLDGISFVIKDLRRQNLGEITEEDARCEGYPSLEMYRNLILRMHKGMTWEAEHPVWVHEFARVE